MGAAIVIHKEPLLFIPTLLLGLSKNRVWLAYLLLIISACFVYTKTSFPELPQEGIEGRAHFQISSITSKSSHFGKQWIYKGVIKSLYPNQSIRNIPVSISYPIKKDLKRPLGNFDYLIDGTLKKINSTYFFIPQKEKIDGTTRLKPWTPLKTYFNLSETRSILKHWVQKKINQKIKEPMSATFLSAMATGDFDDRLLSFHFSRFGLQHIMAISGFHFALLAFILSFLLELVFSRGKACLFLMITLSCYFLFLGFSPSILRAFLMIFIALFGFLFKLPSRALNSLGIALLITLLIDPYLLNQLGFQFSYTTTASILLFYSPIERRMTQIFPKRFLSEAIKMNLLEQHGLIFLAFVKEALSLSLAVNLAVLPLTLYKFQQFPYMSLIYNFFFPFLVSLSLILLILGCLCPFFSFFDKINSSYTKFLLDYVYKMPTTIDYKFCCSEFSDWPLLLYFTFLFFVGVVITFKESEKKEARLDFAYL